MTPLSHAYRRVALLGFMGAGKTTVGRLLAPILGWRFLDTDEILVERHGASIASLFERFGEPRFREWEAEVVASALAQDEAVIALGGGAVEHAGTREVLFGDAGTLTVFLETPLPVALTRCAGEPGPPVRPVLADAERLHARFTSRLPLYRSSRLAILTEKRTPAELAGGIAEAARLSTRRTNGSAAVSSPDAV